MTRTVLPDGERDPYLLGMQHFEVPSLLDAVDADLESDHFARGLLNPHRYQCVSLVDYYGVHLAIELVKRLGVADLLSEQATVAELVSARGFVAGLEAPLRWVLQRLVEVEIAGQQGRAREASYRLLRPLGPSRLAWLRAEAERLDPSIVPTLDLMETGASGYLPVANGERTGERHLWAHFRQWAALLSPSNWYYDLNNQIAARVAADRLPRRPLRVLEVGAGLGSGTMALLAALGPEAVGAGSRVRITEPNGFMRRQLAMTLESALPSGSVELGSLDINKNWVAQGCEGGSLDLVYGVNVFHLAKDVDRVVTEAADALTPGGWLVLGEGIRPFPGRTLPLELVFLLLTDYVDVRLGPHRGQPGFLGPEEWEAVLTQAGLVDVAVVPDLARVRNLCGRISFGAVCGRKS